MGSELDLASAVVDSDKQSEGQSSITNNLTCQYAGVVDAEEATEGGIGNQGFELCPNPSRGASKYCRRRQLIGSCGAVLTFGRTRNVNGRVSALAAVVFWTGLATLLVPESKIFIDDHLE